MNKALVITSKGKVLYRRRPRVVFLGDDGEWMIYKPLQIIKLILPK